MLRVIPRPPQRTMFSGDSYISNTPVQLQPVLSRQSTSNQLISQTVKSSTNLFLTRRLPEALLALRPIVHGPPATLLNCPRVLRKKIWCLYLAILDAAAKMPSAEGKLMWGQQDWPLLVAKVRTGEIWDEVDQSYGDEGEVDAEVVVTLATLLLSHSPDQTNTQRRIESYIGATSISLSPEDDTKSLSYRVMLSEIYTLHVLPRVGEWQYAREFTQLSSDLDDEQKETFYTTLEILQKDWEDAETHSRHLERQRDEELELDRKMDEDHQKSRSSPIGTGRKSSRARGTSVRPPSRTGKVVEDSPCVVKSRRPSTVTKEPKRFVPLPQRKVLARDAGESRSSIVTFTTGLLNRMYIHVGFDNGLSSILRTVIMLVVFVWMTSNKRLRERIRRILFSCWIKVARTVGMGMKVTYV